MPVIDVWGQKCLNKQSLFFILITEVHLLFYEETDSPRFANQFSCEQQMISKAFGSLAMFDKQ